MKTNLLICALAISLNACAVDPVDTSTNPTTEDDTSFDEGPHQEKLAANGLTPEDIQSLGITANTLTQTVVNNLFPGGGSPIGQVVLVRNVPFTVIGVLTARGQSATGQDQDDTVLMPFSSAMDGLRSASGSRPVRSIQPRITPDAGLMRTMRSVSQILA